MILLKNIARDVNCECTHQMYKYEMRIPDNRWCNRAVCAINIWHCAILLCHRQVSDAQE